MKSSKNYQENKLIQMLKTLEISKYLLIICHISKLYHFHVFNLILFKLYIIQFLDFKV